MERRREAKAGVKATCPKVVLSEARGWRGAMRGRGPERAGGVEDVVGDGGGGELVVDAEEGGGRSWRGSGGSLVWGGRLDIV